MKMSNLPGTGGEERVWSSLESLTSENGHCLMNPATHWTVQFSRLIFILPDSELVYTTLSPGCDNYVTSQLPQVTIRVGANKFTETT